MQIGLLLTYLVLVHLGIVFERPILLTIAIPVLATGIFFSGLKSYKVSAWFILIAVAAVSAGFGLLNKSTYLLYLPPVAAPLLIGWGFLRTLRPGQVPLVTDIGEKARGPLSEEMRHYTRGVTIAWAICLMMIASWGILLPLLGSLELWSFFTNIVNQVLVGGLFIGEFIYRKYRFRDHDHPSFWQYLRIVFRTHGDRD